MPGVWATGDLANHFQLKHTANAEARIAWHNLLHPGLIQPLIQAMCLGNTVDEVARGVLYIHPALTEAVEQCLLEL